MKRPKKPPVKPATNVSTLPPPVRKPGRRCTRCGYFVLELEWQALQFNVHCPRCRGDSFEKSFLP